MEVRPGHQGESGASRARRLPRAPRLHANYRTDRAGCAGSALRRLSRQRWAIWWPSPTTLPGDAAAYLIGGGTADAIGGELLSSRRRSYSRQLGRRLGSDYGRSWRAAVLTLTGGELNRSMQHTDRCESSRSVADEVPHAHLLHRGSEGGDVGAMEAGLDAAPDRAPVRSRCYLGSGHLVAHRRHPATATDSCGDRIDALGA